MGLGVKAAQMILAQPAGLLWETVAAVVVVFLYIRQQSMLRVAAVLVVILAMVAMPAISTSTMLKLALAEVVVAEVQGARPTTAELVVV